MHLTAVLKYKAVVKDCYVRLANWHWRNRGSKMKVRKAVLPPEVVKYIATKQRHVEDMFQSNYYAEELLKEIEPGQVSAQFWLDKRKAFKEKEERDAIALFKSIDTLLFQQQSRFNNGLIQAALITQTHVTQGLSPKLQTIFDAISLPDNASEMLQRIIFQSHIWRTDEDKFPKRFRPGLPIFKHKTEYGIHPINCVRYLLGDLLRYTALTHNIREPRLLSRDHSIDTYFNWFDGQRIHFSETRDFMLSFNKPLPLLATLEEVDATKDIQLPSMHPVSPLVDLKTARVKELPNCDGWPVISNGNSQNNVTSFCYPHIFTINSGLINMWSDFLEPETDPVTQDNKNAFILMHCFAQALATARRLYGDEIFEAQKLPEPIVVQAICCDGVYFDFAAFQLNTLYFPASLSGQSVGILKNQAWIDGGHALFNKTVPYKAMLRGSTYSLLNPETYKRFLSMYLYGTSIS